MNLISNRILLENGELYHIRGFLPPEERFKLLPLLRRSLYWRQDNITIFGKKVKQPRLTAWYGEPNLHYAYSGLCLETIPWTSTLLKIRKQVEALGIGNYNAVLLNYYRDGNDSMGYHSDDEPELGPNPIIAIVSLGQRRKLQMKKKKSPERPLNFWLENGDLFIMAGATQHYWYHQIPKSPSAQSARLSLTFRNIITSQK
jgi:alkylated DNA repair dioxygenase AlkB